MVGNEQMKSTWNADNYIARWGRDTERERERKRVMGLELARHLCVLQIVIFALILLNSLSMHENIVTASWRTAVT